MAPDCRACFDLDEQIVELAHKQAAYVAISPQFERRSEALATAEGLAYTECEDRVLRILELATFCQGRRGDDCPLQDIMFSE